MVIEHVNNSHPEVKHKCMICENLSKSFEELLNHETIKHEYVCRFCKLCFVAKEELVTHVTSTYTEKLFLCKYCDEDFQKNFESCLQHEALEHTYKCENCQKCFVDKSVHDKHSLDVHGVSVGLDLKCGQCQERFSNTGAFREHFKIPHKVHCSLCDLRFPAYSNLNNHISKAHSKPSKGEKLICKSCHKKYDSKERADYEEHLKLKHKYQCDDCDMTFVKSGRLRDHIEDFHGHSKSIDEKFTCKLCRTICNKKNDMKLSKEAYKMHCSLPHKFSCRNCNYRFTNKSKLDAHIQEAHTGVSPNECSICGSRFSDLGKLRDHKNEPHKYQCKDDKCKKRFVNEQSLEKHLQRKHKEFAQASLHHGQIIFRCKMCSRTFESNLALQSHQYIDHSFKCHLCEHSYTEKADLTIHLVKVHRVNKVPHAGFRCTHCNLDTKKMIEIRKHLSLNHSYSCKYCPHKYTNKNLLDSHMEESHLACALMNMEEDTSSNHEVQCLYL